MNNHTHVNRHTAKQTGMYSKKLIDRQLASSTDSFLGCSKVFGQMSFDHLSAGNVSVFVFDFKHWNIHTDIRACIYTGTKTYSQTNRHAFKETDR